MSEHPPEIDDPRFLAAYDLLERCGATRVELRYQDDNDPTVWIAIATWQVDGLERHRTAAALNPVTATLRLIERTVDGGMCRHCLRPSAVDIGLRANDAPLLSDALCWYQYDPELETFRRSCEGETGP